MEALTTSCSLGPIARLTHFASSAAGDATTICFTQTRASCFTLVASIQIQLQAHDREAGCQPGHDVLKSLRATLINKPESCSYKYKSISGEAL